MSMLLVRRTRIALIAVIVSACGGPTSATPSVTVVAPSTAPATASGASTAAVSAAPSPAPSAAVLPGEPWIVYQGGSGSPARIRLVRPDGSGDHELAPGGAPGEQLHPDWSRDGERVAFAMDDVDGTRDIWVANADGSGVERVFDCADPCAWTDDPAWSPDDATLLFDRARGIDDVGTGVSTLEVLDLASRTMRTVYAAPPTEFLYVPRWDPTGTAVVVETVRFASARLDEETAVEGTIGIVDLEAAAPAFAPLVDWSAGATYPDWSPDGASITFQQRTSADGGEPADIHVVAVDGSGDRTVTDFGPGGGWGIQPSWTPDGERIIFVGEDTVRTQANVATVGADGDALERMPWDGTFRTHPRLRPVP